ncbi:hypothetical protein [Vibrio spartinae]|uniref:Uncharacterized protein n=1 Tax=Vibrio spartinae TaxID=1918945 RepID=A0A1N6M5M8_9VIBR|nr:hypothetical protein [Vibrio spartinae]SIO94749.1 hypothetical protein VSP9026_02479 [Vibrio spartinae]
MSKLILGLVSLLSLTVVRYCVAGGVDLSWQTSASAMDTRSTILSTVESPGTDYSVDSVVTAKITHDEWFGNVTVMGENLLSSDSTDDFNAYLLVPEVYWQPEIDFLETQYDLTLGKQRLDWGVGYGYRPLDIFKNYHRNPLGIQVDEGVGIVNLSYFDGDGQWSLVATDESWATDSLDDDDIPNQHGIGIRHYTLVNGTEYQGILYFDQIRQDTVGGSVVKVLDPAWEMHSSFVYSKRDISYQLRSFNEEVGMGACNDVYQFLLGFNWADTQGVNIIGEYWYDSRSWDHKRWATAFNRVQTLREKLGKTGLVQSYSNGLENTNMVRHNIMLHLSLNADQNQWLMGVKPTLDLLISPSDGGLVVTQWLSYSIFDSGSFDIQMQLAARSCTGLDSSVYANIPDRHRFIFNIKGSF